MKTLFDIAQPYVPKILGALALQSSSQLSSAVADFCRDVMAAKGLPPLNTISDAELLTRIRNSDAKMQAVLTALLHIVGV